ncbi:recombination protein RecO [Helicobacter jaachi]|uniref:Recombination protein RecO n=1 Tax=Helicobacter jaachi TaxID=1677920 RepID=A0A4U8TA69_9HELI|nr:recombination protein RecO [Helicobacter jaachi]TLD96756.1 recombination protein RecO [Helicobacter jaachi]
MQGYILHIQTTRTEDVIVKILTPQSIKSLYRFYGARHSIINIGRKIDFEEQPQSTFLPKLKNILHLAHKWEFDTHRYYVWQHFIKLLYKHLFDVYEVPRFYFDLLEEGAHKLEKQNPKRVALEMYAKLLDFEGRAQKDTNAVCFICQERVIESVALGRAFVFAHQTCIGGRSFDIAQILSFLRTQSSILLEDDVVDELWEILGLGL